jgi:hypothetical protein
MKYILVTGNNSNYINGDAKFYVGQPIEICDIDNGKRKWPI